MAESADAPGAPSEPPPTAASPDASERAQMPSMPVKGTYKGYGPGGCGMKRMHGCGRMAAGGCGMGRGCAMMGPGYGMGWGRAARGPACGMGGGFAMMQGCPCSRCGCGGRMGMRGRGMKSASPMTMDDARAMVEGRLAYAGNPNLKLGGVTDQGATFEAEILTHDGSLVDKLIIHKTMGWMRSIY